MFEFLEPNVACDRRQLFQPHRSQVISGIPPKRLVTFGLGEEKSLEEIGHRLIDERQSRPAGPREMGVEANRHWMKLGAQRALPKTRRAHGAYLRTRVVAEPVL